MDTAFDIPTFQKSQSDIYTKIIHKQHKKINSLNTCQTVINKKIRVPTSREEGKQEWSYNKGKVGNHLLHFFPQKKTYM